MEHFKATFFKRKGVRKRGMRIFNFQMIEANLSKFTMRCNSGDWKFNWKDISI